MSGIRGAFIRRGAASIAAVALCAAGAAMASPAQAGPKDSLIDRIIARADPSLLQVVVTTKTTSGVPRVDTIQVPSLVVARRVLADMAGRPGVLAVDMNHRYRMAGFNDPYYPYQWALNSKHLRFGAINYLTRNDTAHVKIAVLDTGVSTTHPDVPYPHRYTGYNAVSPGAASTVDCGVHGTHVMGIIGAAKNNGRGVIGLAQRAYVRPVKVFDPAIDCSADSSTLAAAIYWAAHGETSALGTPRARVINMSMAGGTYDQNLADAISFAQRRGLVIVAAAGNVPDIDPGVTYPAAYPGVVGVAAAQQISSPPYYQVASFSNSGSWVDVAAPGVDILSTVPKSYAYLSGTSMAAPYVSATIALAMQHCHWSAATARTWMLRTATTYPTRTDQLGYGVIRPYRLLRCGA